MTDNIIHETDRNTKTARASQNPGGEAVARWPWDSPNRSNGRGIAQLCSSLERCVQKRQTKSTGKQTASVKAMQTVRQATVKTSKASLKRPRSKWLQNRFVDTTKDRTDNKKAFWPIVPTLRGLVCSLSYGIELPKTREASQRTQQTSHRMLAKERLASYKKKPVEPAELLYRPMKAVLCLP